MKFNDWTSDAAMPLPLYMRKLEAARLRKSQAAAAHGSRVPALKLAAVALGILAWAFMVFGG